MKALGAILAAFVVLALLQAATAVLFMVFVVGLLWGVACRPRETFGFLIFCVVAGLIQNHGLAFLGLIGGVLVVCLIAKLLET